MTADNKHSRCNVHNFEQQVQTPLSQKQKTFAGFFIAFLKCPWKLENFEKKISIIALLFQKWWSAKEVITQTSKRSYFRRPWGNQRVNGFQTLLKSTRHHYYPIFPCICDILSWKKSPLVWSEILRLFLNTLTADKKYPAAMCTISRNKFKRTYIKNKRLFLDFVLHFWNVHEI